MNNFFLALLLVLLLNSCNNISQNKTLHAQNSDENFKLNRELKTDIIINQTFLGNSRRNFYGNEAPSKLDIIWALNLGTGKTRVGSSERLWSGAGWTGQPLMIKENDRLYIIQGCYDHHLKKIDAEKGKIVAQYEFDDVIKGTGSIWEKNDKNGIFIDFFILQGSRLGLFNNLSTPIVKSYRAVKLSDMSGAWIYNSKRMLSYSRDVDGSALIINDTAYLGLENGLFIVFSPDPAKAKIIDGILQPKIYDVDTLFFPDDTKLHGGNLVTESSPSLLNDHVYITSGSGHIFGYNLKKKK